MRGRRPPDHVAPFDPASAKQIRKTGRLVAQLLEGDRPLLGEVLTYPFERNTIAVSPAIAALGRRVYPIGQAAVQHFPRQLRNRELPDRILILAHGYGPKIP
jgi:hypothetical protein